MRASDARISVVLQASRAVQERPSPTNSRLLIEASKKLIPFDLPRIDFDLRVRIQREERVLADRQDKLDQLVEAITIWAATRNTKTLQSVLARLDPLTEFDRSELNGAHRKAFEIASAIVERASLKPSNLTASNAVTFAWFIDQQNSEPANPLTVQVLHQALSDQGWRFAASRSMADIILQLQVTERHSTTAVGGSSVNGVRVTLYAEARWILDHELLLATRSEGNGASTLAHTDAADAAWRKAATGLANNIRNAIAQEVPDESGQ